MIKRYQNTIFVNLGFWILYNIRFWISNVNLGNAY